MSAKFPNDPDGIMDYIKATKWLAESFHNTWLTGIPE